MGICVTDLERSLRFYRDVLGCEEVGRMDVAGPAVDRLNGLEGVSARTIYLERDGWRLELMAFDAPAYDGATGPRPMNRPGLTHLSFRVDDLDAVLADLEDAGGSLLPATRIDMEARGTRVIMALDPDGLRLELIEGPGDPNAVPGSARYLVAG